MDCFMLIKVTSHVDTTRRFFVNIDEEDGQLDLDISSLRAKIVELFDYPSDASFALTYTDEHGERVALIDDNDLRDISMQSLKCLRIAVRLASPAAMYPRAYDIQNRLSYYNPQPPPFSPYDITASKLGQSNANPAQQSRAKENAGGQTVASGVSVAPSGDKVLNACNVDKTNNEVSTKNVTNKSAMPASATLGLDRTELVESNSSDSSKLTNEKDSSPASATRDEKVLNPCNVEPEKMSVEVGAKNVTKKSTMSASTPVSSDKTEVLKSNPSDSSKLKNEMDSSPAPTTGDEKETDKQNARQQSVDCVSLCASPDFVPLDVIFPPMIKKKGDSLAADSISCLGKSYARYVYGDNMPPRLHWGVRCNGCGAHPMPGPHYESKLETDYKLCWFCYEKMGSEAEYIMIENPLISRDQHEQYRKLLVQHNGALPLGTFLSTWSSWKHSNKLDCSFISDVTIPPATVMPPSTSFTKIWRMRNSGTDVWPQGTRLVWIYGDRFGHDGIAELDIPTGGAAPKDELDMAARFTSPDLPGMYRSFWRMISPCGTLFGFYIRLLILVKPSDEIASKSLKCPSLCLPSTNTGGPLGPETKNANVQSNGTTHHQELPSDFSFSGLVKHVTNEHPLEDKEQSQPTNDAITTRSSTTCIAPKTSFSFESLPFTSTFSTPEHSKDNKCRSLPTCGAVTNSPGTTCSAPKTSIGFERQAANASPFTSPSSTPEHSNNDKIQSLPANDRPAFRTLVTASPVAEVSPFSTPPFRTTSKKVDSSSELYSNMKPKEVKTNPFKNPDWDTIVFGSSQHRLNHFSADTDEGWGRF